MLQIVRDEAFPFIKDLGQFCKGSTYAKHMKNAVFLIASPALLATVIEQIEKIAKIQGQMTFLVWSIILGWWEGGRVEIGEGEGCCCIGRVMYVCVCCGVTIESLHFKCCTAQIHIRLYTLVRCFCSDRLVTY